MCPVGGGEINVERWRIRKNQPYKEQGEEHKPDTFFSSFFAIKQAGKIGYIEILQSFRMWVVWGYLKKDHIKLHRCSNSEWC